MHASQASFEDEPVRLQTSKAEELTIKALKNINQDNWRAARENVWASKDPLAVKLYYWMLFTRKKTQEWDNQNFIRLTHFVRKNKGWPEVAQLKILVEGVMPDTLSNAEVLSWYDDYAPVTPMGMERYMDSMIIEGRSEKARTFLANWWAETITSRDQQRRIFNKYGPYLTLDAHKRRLDALLLSGDFSNARGIAAVLGPDYQALAEARIVLAQNQGSVEGPLKAVPAHLLRDPGLMYERLRWRREHDYNEGAIEILVHQPPASQIRNKEAWWKERHIIIRRLLENHDYQRAYDLARAHYQDDGVPFADAQWLAGWLALRFLHKPNEAYEYFTAMHAKVETPVSRSRAAYWAGRAAAVMKQDTQARRWYREAAQFRTVFYGQLAGNELMLDGSVAEDDIPALSSADYDKYQQNELAQTANLFLNAGMKTEFSKFLIAFVDLESTPGAYRYAAELALKSGDYNLAIKISKKAIQGGWIMTKHSYPVMSGWTKSAQGVESPLVHAIIRQESVFDPNARSPAGALGLMQLMPTTAEEVARKLDAGYSASWLTQRPDYNVKLGSTYLARMLLRYEGYYPLAIAAYNAGPSRVDGWLKTFGDPRKGDIDLLDWIEIIPVSETRNYVQRVMEGLYIYRLRLGGIQTQPHHDMNIANR